MQIEVELALQEHQFPLVLFIVDLLLKVLVENLLVAHENYVGNVPLQNMVIRCLLGPICSFFRKCQDDVQNKPIKVDFEKILDQNQISFHVARLKIVQLIFLAPVLVVKCLYVRSSPFCGDEARKGYYVKDMNIKHSAVQSSY